MLQDDQFPAIDKVLTLLRARFHNGSCNNTVNQSNQCSIEKLSGDNYDKIENDSERISFNSKNNHLHKISLQNISCEKSIINLEVRQRVLCREILDNKNTYIHNRVYILKQSIIWFFNMKLKIYYFEHLKSYVSQVKKKRSKVFLRLLSTFSNKKDFKSHMSRSVQYKCIARFGKLKLAALFHSWWLKKITLQSWLCYCANLNSG